MAITSKVTYSLKPQTTQRVAELALAWGVPRSEVIRRAVDQLALATLEDPTEESPLDVFRRLQEKDGISRPEAAKFNAEVSRERRASGIKRG